jgi:hypothetical protein
MNKATYTAKPTAAELLTPEQARERYQLSRNTLDQKAAECGAALKIGRSKRYVRRKLDEYLECFQA